MKQPHPFGAAAAIALSIVVAAPAKAENAFETRKEFNIAAGPAGRAITEFARQAGINVLASGENLANIETTEVKGTFSISEALEKLLSGTSLSSKVNLSGAVFIGTPWTKHHAIKPNDASRDQVMKKNTLNQPILGKTMIAAAAMSLFGNLHAEETPADQVVLVTGSRIASRGFNQPTPTTTFTSDDITKAAEPNIFDAIAQLPALQGSLGASILNNSTSSGIQGVSAFSLRGLGAIRTLTLLDGQRVMPGNVTGVTDISQFPQLLIKRVDVVTGGASASYGSDAVGGVVNLITDKRFTGVKANIEAGESNYHDAKNSTLQLAWGKGFLDDKLHVTVSGEHSLEGGVDGNGFGMGAGPNGRSFYTAPAFQVRTIAQTADGKPQIYDIRNAQQYQYSKYGLITSGPLQGTAFGDNGMPYSFQYGSNGIPTKTGAVTNCISPYCVGGDLTGNVGNSKSLASKLNRNDLYSRVSYAVDGDTEVYATVNFAEVRSSNTPNVGATKLANLTIQCENPYVPASIKAACLSNNITSFQYGTANGEFPKSISVHPTRQQQRYVVGIDGAFDARGTRWSYNGYAQHGVNFTDLYVKDISLTPRYNAAIDAIALSDGSIVCRSLVARAAGCQPLNILGNVTPSAGALAYVLPSNGPEQHTRQTQDVVSLNISGEPVSLWAGPLALASGVEYRKEAYKVHADPYGTGVMADSPNSAAFPADPLLNTSAGNNWFAGNYHNGEGAYSVKEIYLEGNLPVLKSDTWGEANLNVAARATNYSTSGNANTWKVGGTWKTGIDGIRLRAVTSRDVRAPNLSELYAAPVVINAAVKYKGQSMTIQQQTVGNTQLRPEIARNTELGIILSQPKWLPGLNVSVDYYKIKVAGVISTLLAQQEVDLCEAGNQELCAAMLLNSPVATNNYVRLQAFNLASLDLKGVDIEASYRSSLSSFGLPGAFTARALATRTIDYITDSGVVGAIPSQGAGVNLGATPKWKLLASQAWNNDRTSITVTERWISDGVYSNEYIECQSNCPMATAAYATIDNNQMKGALYVDIGGTYKISEHLLAYFKVDNVANRNPPAAPFTGVSYGINPALYDVLGRMYRGGVRMSF